LALLRRLEKSMFLTRLTLVAALLAGLAASAAAGFALLRPAPEPPREQPAAARGAADIEAKAVAKFNHHGYVYSSIFSPDCRYLITAGSDFEPDNSTGQSLNGRVRLWKLDTAKEVDGPPPVRHIVRAAAVSPDGRWLVYSTGGYRLGSPTRPSMAQ